MRRFPRVRSSLPAWLVDVGIYMLTCFVEQVAETVVAGAWKAARKALRRWRKARRKASRPDT